MAVVELSSYDDFKLMVGDDCTQVFYWPDNDPYWYAYARVTGDWFWLRVSAGLEAEPAEAKMFKRDYPEAKELENGMVFR